MSYFSNHVIYRTIRFRSCKIPSYSHKNSRCNGKDACYFGFFFIFSNKIINASLSSSLLLCVCVCVSLKRKSKREWFSSRTRKLIKVRGPFVEGTAKKRLNSSRRSQRGRKKKKEREKSGHHAAE